MPEVVKTMRLFQFFSWVALFGLTACSLIVNSSSDKLPCDDEKRCLEGYFCHPVDKICLKKGSLEQGMTCSDKSQCAPGLECPLGVDACIAKTCTKIFSDSADNGCDANSVCYPNFDRERPGLLASVPAVCVRNECASDDDCIQKRTGALVPLNARSDARKCFRFNNGGGLCGMPCEVGIKIADDRNGKDSCGRNALGINTVCGLLPTGDKTCLPTGGGRFTDQCSLFPAAPSLPACAETSSGFDNLSAKPLPLLCLNDSGNSKTGTLTCHIIACTKNTDCAAGQICCENRADKFNYCVENGKCPS